MHIPLSRPPWPTLIAMAWAVAGMASPGCGQSGDRVDPAAGRQPGPVRVTSPNGEVEFVLLGGPEPRYRVGYRGKPVIVNSRLGLELVGQSPLLPGGKRIATETGGVDETYRVPVGKANPVRNHHNTARVDFQEAEGSGRRIGVEIRAYDDGVAFRYVLPEQAALKQVQITRERTEFCLSKDATTYPIILPGYESSYEDEYQKRLISGLHRHWLIGIPLLAELPGVAWVAITEAHLDNYPGMYLRVAPGPFALEPALAPHSNDPKVAVIGTTPLQSPWRVLMLGQEPGRLVESNILLNLNPPSAVADPAWIQAGKAAWNWWSGSHAEDVAFQPGMNTATIKHYIDFAADSGFPYMLIDEGWAERHGGMETDDLTKTAPDVDMPEILRHAKARGVKIWLWAHWIPVDRQMDRAFPLFERWGVAGVKIDFMAREDQDMVNWYRRTLARAAQHHLMIDYHGAYKPDGIERTYPNLLTREAVMGTEYLKWSARVTPEYDCTLPFTRMLAGPFDYCPGGFHNATRAEFTPRESRPMVMGTRAHQLALYVVFESELQMVSDYPERYKGEPDFAFIRQVPATWDETRVLAGRPMEFIAMARRAGDAWFVGCLTNWDERDLEIPLGFLGAGRFGAEIYADAPDSGSHPMRTMIRREDVDRATRLKVHMAPGGGAALRIRPAEGPSRDRPSGP